MSPDDRQGAETLRMLPAFELTVRGVRVALPASAQRIIAHVAISQRPLSRNAAATLLWPELAADRSAASLRSTLWQARRRAPGVLGTDAHTIWLGESVDVDYARAVEAARAPTQAGADTFQQDLLVEWTEDWVLLERERYRQIRLHALEELCRELVSAGEMCAAIEVGLHAVGADPLRETGQRALIKAHLADGNLSEAIRQYRAFENVLALELGVAPTSGLSELVGIRR